MAPLVKEFLKYSNEFETKVCVTAQHREMLDQVLEFFEIIPDYDLDLMRANQNLHSLTADIIKGLKPILDEFSPDYIYVHGDTTTTMAASIAGFYSGSKICHIEAGLRTYNKLSPFPEEMNRQLTGRLADYHFTPTKTTCENLLEEGVNKSNICITGNTVIDALLEAVDRVDQIDHIEINQIKNKIDLSKEIILVTGHRRENHGQGFFNICKALKELAIRFPKVQIIYPVHLNPNVKEPVYNLLSELDNVILLPPLSYPAFVWIMKKCRLIITDSGGIQEEAPSLGKPVLVMRESTERVEALELGLVKLVGTNISKIINETSTLLRDVNTNELVKNVSNPYGNGLASKQVVDFIKGLDS